MAVKRPSLRKVFPLRWEERGPSQLKEKEPQALAPLRTLLGVMILLNEIPKREGHRSWTWLAKPKLLGSRVSVWLTTGTDNQARLNKTSHLLLKEERLQLKWTPAMWQDGDTHGLRLKAKFPGTTFLGFFTSEWREGDLQVASVHHSRMANGSLWTPILF